MASLVGHHKSRGEAILMVEGTASQGVAHASDRCIPCQGEKERGHRQVKWDMMRSEPSPATSGTVVSACGPWKTTLTKSHPPQSNPGPSCPCVLGFSGFPPGLQLPTLFWLLLQTSGGISRQNTTLHTLSFYTIFLLSVSQSVSQQTSLERFPCGGSGWHCVDYYGEPGTVACTSNPSFSED